MFCLSWQKHSNKLVDLICWNVAFHALFLMRESLKNPFWWKALTSFLARFYEKQSWKVCAGNRWERKPKAWFNHWKECLGWDMREGGPKLLENGCLGQIQTTRSSCICIHIWGAHSPNMNVLKLFWNSIHLLGLLSIFTCCLNKKLALSPIQLMTLWVYCDWYPQSRKSNEHNTKKKIYKTRQ